MDKLEKGVHDISLEHPLESSVGLRKEKKKRCLEETEEGRTQLSQDVQTDSVLCKRREHSGDSLDEMGIEIT